MLKWTRYSYDKLSPNERLFATAVHDGMLRCVVTVPPRIALPGGAIIPWMIQVDHVPYSPSLLTGDGVSRVTEGLALVPLANPAEQMARRCPTIEEVTDAKMQLVESNALLGIIVQRSDRLPYMVQAVQIGTMAAPPGQLPPNPRKALALT